MGSPLPGCHGVLVVDDDQDIRESLVEALEDEGFSVLVASNGSDALEKLRAAGAPPCVILLDLMMPVMDGWQFRDEQQRDQALARIPVVVLTADGNARQKAAKMQVDEGIPKPIRLDHLLSVVGRYCQP